MWLRSQGRCRGILLLVLVVTCDFTPSRVTETVHTLPQAPNVNVWHDSPLDVHPHWYTPQLPGAPLLPLPFTSLHFLNAPLPPLYSSTPLLGDHSRTARAPFCLANREVTHQEYMYGIREGHTSPPRRACP